MHTYTLYHYVMFVPIFALSLLKMAKSSYFWSFLENLATRAPHNVHITYIRPRVRCGCEFTYFLVKTTKNHPLIKENKFSENLGTKRLSTIFIYRLKTPPGRHIGLLWFATAAALAVAALA